MSNKFSVLILTLNEDKCISNAINSVLKWSDDIVVIDSLSTDKTTEIVNSFECVRLYEHEFKDFGDQRNFGLHQVKYKNEWVFLLDADEVCTDELAQEMIDVISEEKATLISYSVRRRDFFNNKWIKVHASVWFERLVKHDEVLFTGIVHEKLNSAKKQGELKERFNHYPFSKGITNWITRHSIYAEKMAVVELEQSLNFKIMHLFSPKNDLRNTAQRAIFRKLPFRYVFYFLYKFFIKGGYRNGIDGFYFVIIETFYQFLVNVNVRLLRNGKRVDHA